MDYQHELVKQFHVKAGQAAPDRPTIPPLETRILRARLILEEALEIVQKGLGLDVVFRDELKHFIHSSDLTFSKLRFRDSGKDPNIIELADGCADLKVVTVGTEIACGIDGEPCFREVMRSNMTKFEGGSMREDGKVLKGPNYEPPNLPPILKSQGATP